MRGVLLRRSVPPCIPDLRVDLVTSSGDELRCCGHRPSFGDMTGIDNSAIETRKAKSPYTAIRI